MKHSKQELIEKAMLLYKEVYKFAVSRTKDQEVAKDIAQTVMEIVVLKIDTLKNSDSLKPWIMQITSNEIKGYFRELKQLRDNTIVNDRNEVETIFDEIRDVETDILQGITQRESQKNIIKALLRLEEDDIKVPEPDLSFLLKESGQKNSSMDLDFLDITKKRNTFFSRFGRAVAILLAILITSSAITIFINSDVSYGVKSALQNVKHFFLPEKEASMDKNGQETLEVTNWEDIQAGKAVVGKLYIPNYVPKGHTFAKATFIRSDSTSTSDYLFEKGQNSILISIETLKTSADVYVTGKLYKSPGSGKEMYLEKDKSLGQYTATYLDGNHSFVVSGLKLKEETAKVIENIKALE